MRVLRKIPTNIFLKRYHLINKPIKQINYSTGICPDNKEILKEIKELKRIHTDRLNHDKEHDKLVLTFGAWYISILSGLCIQHMLLKIL